MIILNILILDLSLNVILPSKIFDRLKSISFKHKNDFNALIDRISQYHSNNLSWWIESPSTRNTLQSSLFYRFCCIYLLKDLIKTGINVDKVIVDSPAMINLIKEFRRIHSIDFIIEGPENKSPKLFQNFLQSIKSSIILLKKYRKKFNAANKTAFLSAKPPKDGLIIIDQFVFPGYITNDRYYNGLWDELTLEQMGKTFFVPTLVMMDENEFEPAYRELRKSKKNFLIKEDYLGISDLIFSLFHIIKVWFIRPHTEKVMDINFSPLIREELLYSRLHEGKVEGLLNYRFAKSLKEQSFDLSLIIDWWEGQPMDKGWNFGFHTYFPKTEKKGYLGSVPTANNLQLFPSEIEIKHNVSPPIIATIGEEFSFEMNANNKHFKAETAPAFRFSHLWKNSRNIKKDTSEYRILIALSVLENESVNILNLIYDSNLIENKNIKFILNPHPTMKFEILKAHFGKKWSSRIQKGNNPTYKEIKKADLLITGMSAVGLEAISMGVPVIVVETMRGLSYIPIPESISKELWRICRSSKEVSKEVDSFRNRSKEALIHHQELSLNIKNKYFEPVTKKSVQRFLEFN
ncbi:MAG: hypothetical protein CMG74_07520 [Candidatus Marinimicrobia bacterium]|nr:hypothetical protein [Candidatus Neomarinimicrobiota bacterium]|tara:strand:+ start:10419 stop:12146 length:1728 start_codon:yes stop_codon:yes gene_type:complete